MNLGSVFFLFSSFFKVKSCLDCDKHTAKHALYKRKPHEFRLSLAVLTEPSAKGGAARPRLALYGFPASNAAGGNLLETKRALQTYHEPSGARGLPNCSLTALKPGSKWLMFVKTDSRSTVLTVYQVAALTT